MSGVLVSTSLQNVEWTFLIDIWRVVSMNSTLWDACLWQCPAGLQNDEVCRLRCVEYAFFLLGALFAVPMRVLTDDEDLCGKYGWMLRKWWVVAYASFYA